MLRKILYAVLAVTLVVTTVGCGGGGNGNENNLDGRWEFGDNTSREFVIRYEFSGGNFTAIRNESAGQYISGSVIRTRLEEVARSGTFSISGDYIEFVYENGDIVVHPFSRTENTVSIGGTRYTRAGGATPEAPASADPTPAAPAPTAGSGELDGRWKFPEPFDDCVVEYVRVYDAVEFSGSNFSLFYVTFHDRAPPGGIWTERARGTFSIHGNQMEVVVSYMMVRDWDPPHEARWEPVDGEPVVEVSSFSRIDENTIILDGGQFVRVP